MREFKCTKERNSANSIGARTIISIIYLSSKEAHDQNNPLSPVPPGHKFFDKTHI